MNEMKSVNTVRTFDQAYINGQFVPLHGKQVIDLVNPTNNQVIGKVAMADEIDARKAVGRGEGIFHIFFENQKETANEISERFACRGAQRNGHPDGGEVWEIGRP